MELPFDVPLYVPMMMLVAAIVIITVLRDHGYRLQWPWVRYIIVERPVVQQPQPLAPAPMPPPYAPPPQVPPRSCAGLPTQVLPVRNPRQTMYKAVPPIVPAQPGVTGGSPYQRHDQD